jgi:carboxymethylenebutenolidase
MSDRTSVSRIAGLAFLALSGCVNRPPADTHAEHSSPSSAPVAALTASSSNAIPAPSTEVAARLASSPRHAEWVMVRTPRGDSVRAWVVYPERKDKAPVVLVVHEIFGLSSWIRGVADQLAADGFIAIAPDLLTGKLPGPPDTTNADSARAVIRTLNPAVVQEQLDAVAQYGMSLPSAVKRYGIVGFCWGGATSFAHAVHQPALGASVVYYGGSPEAVRLDSVRAPVLGLYGGLDNRVNATIPRADSVLKARGRVFEPHIFDGAGHGFLRQHGGENGAGNIAASKAAWPLTLAFFRKHLGA